MPLRNIPLVKQEFYHVMNRGISSIPIFKDARDYQRFVLTFQYYQHFQTPMKFSKFLIQSVAEREQTLANLDNKNDYFVDLVAYCLMPNHFHFLLRQIRDNGICNFIRLTSNSYSRYFNSKHPRKGPIFEGRFKAIRIETNEQLLHLSRYIHLNPYSGFLVRNIKDLIKYSYSSLPEYLNLSAKEICQKETILFNFKNIEDYQKFVTDQANYQRNLQIIKHQLLEEIS